MQQLSLKNYVLTSPKGLNKPALGDRGKRDILDPFTSFYLAKNAQQQQQDSSRNKRENQVSILPTISYHDCFKKLDHFRLKIGYYFYEIV